MNKRCIVNLCLTQPFVLLAPYIRSEEPVLENARINYIMAVESHVPERQHPSPLNVHLLSLSRSQSLQYIAF